jgi:integrase
MYDVVSSRIEALKIRVPLRGPHCLRHGCAGHLVAAGLSPKEIGDHLGHRGASATRVYAKLDLVGLREVADFDLRGASMKLSEVVASYVAHEQSMGMRFRTGDCREAVAYSLR